jgi:hypothetical protein
MKRLGRSFKNKLEMRSMMMNTMMNPGKKKKMDKSRMALVKEVLLKTMRMRKMMTMKTLHQDPRGGDDIPWAYKL